MELKIGDYVIEGHLGDYSVTTYGNVLVRVDKQYTGETKYGEIKKVYYGNLNQCLNYIKEMEITKQDKVGINQLQEVIESFSNIVEQELKKLGLK